MNPSKINNELLWHLIEKYSRAYKQGFWIETICLQYILLDAQITFLLAETNAGKPITKKQIKAEKFLIDLSKLALINNYIDSNTHNKIKKFNKIRRKTIHNIAEGKIKFNEIEKEAKEWGKLYKEIQNKYLKITPGKPQSVKSI